MNIIIKSIRLLVLVCLIVPVRIYSQSVYTNPSAIVFDSSLTSSKDSIALWIVNSTVTQIEIPDINIYSDVFSIKDTSCILKAKDSVKTWIYFSSIHNLSYNDFVFIETNLSSGSVIVPLSGTKKYSEPLYATTQGKSGEPLKTVLTAIASKGQVALGYTIARDKMYGNMDSNNGLDSVECIYTGRKAKFATRADATANNFNCEHTWPQSKFSSLDPMVSDLNHLFSTDEAANGKRSNYPFGVVVTSTWNVGGSKYGTGYGGQIVFEPRDQHKGDCARAMLYFITRYPNNYGSFWAESPYQEAAFRDWNKRFPPTPKSKKRNDGVQQFQGNRNPFIDHPEFVDRINNFAGTATIITAPKLIVSPMKVIHANVIVGNETGFYLTFANSGNAPLKITSTVFSNSFYSLGDSISDIEIGGTRRIYLSYKPTAATTDSISTLTVTYNDGVSTKSVIVSFTVMVTPMSVSKLRTTVPNQLLLEQNYPNPFNPSTVINFRTRTTSYVALKIYNVAGKEITTLVSRVLDAGYYSTTFDASKMPSGTYFAQLQCEGIIQIKKMSLLK